DELQTRGMLKTDQWLYGSLPPGGTATGDVPFIQPNTGVFDPGIGLFNVDPATNNVDGTGHAFVIDPMGVSAITPPLSNLDIFPYHDADPSSAKTVLQNYWNPNVNDSLPTGFSGISGERWPIRRLSVDIDPALATFVPMTNLLAELIFTLRDDLVSEQPKEDDHPAIQRWETTDPNNTPNDPTDDTLLARQFQGNYSWLATIVPTSNAALLGLQPADPGYGQYDYDVSVVVFRKRDITPSEESERLVDARMLPGGEVEMFIEGNNIVANLDPAFKDIRS
ncbi:unnamed protein product, partial [marine sediment metagenome]